MSILQIVDLKKDYGEEPNITHALKGIQFEVDKGEFVGIMGASGSGKTTLLNCISTIDTATDGHMISLKDSIRKCGSINLTLEFFQKTSFMYD